MQIQIRKVVIEDKQFHEVRYRENVYGKWTAADLHSDIRDAEEQRSFIANQL